MNRLTKLVGLPLLLLVISCVGFGMLNGQKAQAIAGAPTNFFPEVNTSGVRDVYAITQIVSTSEANWATKMKAKTTLAAIYIPDTMVGQNINMTIIHGCDGGGARDGNWWNGAGTNFVVAGGPLTNSKVCGASANKNINYNFIGQATTDVIYDGMTRYYGQTFVADAYGPETGALSLRYTNTFQLLVNTPGVYAGISTKAINCDIGNYPR